MRVISWAEMNNMQLNEDKFGILNYSQVIPVEELRLWSPPIK